MCHIEYFHKIDKPLIDKQNGLFYHKTIKQLKIDATEKLAPVLFCEWQKMGSNREYKQCYIRYNKWY